MVRVRFCKDSTCIDTQNKNWDKTNHEYGGVNQGGRETRSTSFVCNPGYKMGKWNAECTKGVNVREVQETICDDKKFLKISQAHHDEQKSCIHQQFRPAEMSNIKKDKYGKYMFKVFTKSSLEECQAMIATVNTGKYATFKQSLYQNNCFIAKSSLKGWTNYPSKWKKGATGWQTVKADCNVNYHQAAGSNPSKIVMKYKQTRTCADKKHYARVFVVKSGHQNSVAATGKESQDALAQSSTERQEHLSTEAQRNSN